MKNQHTHKLNPPKNTHQKELLAEYDRRLKQFAFTRKNFEKAHRLLQATLSNMTKEGMLVKIEEAPIERDENTSTLKDAESVSGKAPITVNPS